MFFKNLNKNFLLATFGNCLFFVNFSCFFLLPLFLDANNYSKSEVGIVMSTFGFSSILLTPYTSTLIDKYGKKILSLIALFLMIISSISYIFIVDFKIILLLRVIQGAAFSIFFNSSSAIASNSLNDKEKKDGLSFFSSFTIISYFLGPFFAEKIILHFGFTEFFVYASVFSLISFGLMTFIVDEKGEIDNEIQTSSFFSIIKESKILKILVANFLLASGFGVVMNFLSLSLKEKGLSIGLFFVGYSIVVSLSRIFLSNSLSTKNLFNKILIMLGGFALAIFFVPSITSIYHVVLFSVFFSLSYSLVYPFLSSIALVGKSKSLTGRIFGAINSSFSIGVNVMTFLFGFIAEIFGFAIMFKFASLIIFFGVFMLYFNERERIE
ncbi:MFS transporter [bacterium]|nr:MFS transporter [bacterium]